jgi:hypothetical protein
VNGYEEICDGRCFTISGILIPETGFCLCRESEFPTLTLISYSPEEAAAGMNVW